LALKGNQATLHQDVVLFLDDPASRTTKAAPVIDADHGRIETRTATVSTDVEWLVKTHQWPGLRAVGKVERSREIDGKVTSETAYYLLSAPLSPERLNEVARSHWGVENRLHWRLDVVMNEDQDRSRLGNAPHNLAVLRHMALNVMQKPKKAPCEEKSKKPAGTKHISPDSRRSFEMRLPWRTTFQGADHSMSVPRRASRLVIQRILDSQGSQRLSNGQQSERFAFAPFKPTVGMKMLIQVSAPKVFAMPMDIVATNQSILRRWRLNHPRRRCGCEFGLTPHPWRVTSRYVGRRSIGCVIKFAQSQLLLAGMNPAPSLTEGSAQRPIFTYRPMSVPCE
jgi:predicted transposase YbfD/YdcC